MTILFLLILGLSIGSFLNVLADRWSNEEGIGGRSHCEQCNHTLSPLDLIPVISFLILRGRCRYCKTRLSWYYPASEILTGILFVLLTFVIPAKAGIYLNGSPIESGMTYVSYFGIICSLIVIFLADLKYHIIPDEALFAMAFFSIPMVFFNNTLPDSIIGGIVLSGLMYILYILTRGRGMGLGDVKYTLLMGFLLGLVRGLLGLYIAFISGACISIILIVTSKKGLKSKIPFGPFLILGTIIMLFYAQPVTNFVRSLFSL